MSDLEIMIDELKAKEDKLIKEKEPYSYVIYKRSLPSGINKVVAQNLPTYEDGIRICVIMKYAQREELPDGKVVVKFTPKLEIDGDKTVWYYYEVLPDTKEYKDVNYNEDKITSIGNDKRKVSIRYFGLE